MRVERTAFVLGVAGLLPQVAAVFLLILSRRGATDMTGLLAMAGYGLAIGYGTLILSFLGGIWWAFAMRRETRQGGLAGVAVVPSLVGLAAIVWTAGTLPGRPSAGPAFLLGAALLLTLVVDRHLVATGEAPANWLRLRAPLSVGLAALTVAAGALLVG